MNVTQVSAASLSSDQHTVVTLTFSQAIAVWLLHWKGEKDYEIAAKLGTNTLRIDAVLHERQHVGSRQKAQELA